MPSKQSRRLGISKKPCTAIRIHTAESWCLLGTASAPIDWSRALNLTQVRVAVLRFYFYPQVRRRRECTGIRVLWAEQRGGSTLRDLPWLAERYKVSSYVDVLRKYCNLGLCNSRTVFGTEEVSTSAGNNPGTSGSKGSVQNTAIWNRNQTAKRDGEWSLQT